MSHLSLDLAKEHLLDLNKIALDVVKDSGLGTQKAQVGVAFDKSGSMMNLYSSGKVQEAADRILALAMEFDDNKAIDVFTFNNQGTYVGEMTEANFFGYVQNNIARNVGGGTSYAPVMRDILKHYGFAGGGGGMFSSLFKSKPTLADPVYIMFVTDGDNSDHTETEKVIREAAKLGVFWKFVGIGSESFSFLQKLDDLSGRFIDNADFIKVNDMATVNEQDLYKRLLQEFPSWISEARSKNLIK